MIRGLCDIEGCGRPHYGLGLCRTHYMRQRKGQPLNTPVRRVLFGLPVAERLLAWVAKTESGCWQWTGALSTAGYGVTSGAHRLSYETFVGPVPDGLQLDHLCRNRACVNPAHLEPVTLQENLRRGESVPAVNARKTHCIRGHELPPPGGPRRQCKVCMHVRYVEKRDKALWRELHDRDSDCVGG